MELHKRRRDGGVVLGENLASMFSSDFRGAAVSYGKRRHDQSNSGLGKRRKELRRDRFYQRRVVTTRNSRSDGTRRIFV